MLVFSKESILDLFMTVGIFVWKSLPNRLTRDKKIVIHGNSCIILYISPGNRQ